MNRKRILRTTAYLLSTVLLLQASCSDVAASGSGFTAPPADYVDIDYILPEDEQRMTELQDGETAVQSSSYSLRAGVTETGSESGAAEITAGEDSAAAETADGGNGALVESTAGENDVAAETAVSGNSMLKEAAEEVEIEAETSGEDTIPAAYRSDSVEVDGETVSYLQDEFRDQNPYGCCWAFSALAACETSMIRKGLATGSIDLSERHLIYYFYNKGETLTDYFGRTAGDYDTAVKAGATYLTQGGNNLLTMWHLVSWCGAVSEDSAPYSGLVADSSADTNGLLGQENTAETAYGSDVAHVQNAFLINMGDMDEQISCKQTMKKLIMEYGSLAMSYYSSLSSSYDSVTYDSYYQTYSTSTNHAVTVVGWDDTFPKENFATQPPGDGAWLIRNSWGEESTSNAQSGFFWLSYYDSSINDYTDSNGNPVVKYAYVYDAEPADNYDKIYQYDGDSSTKTASVLSAANRFTAGDGSGKTEVLKSVGIGVAQSNVRCVVSIYKNLTSPDSDPTSGEKVLSQEVQLGYPGYHTIELSQEIDLPDGCEFSVVFTFPDATIASTVPLYISKDCTYTNGGKPFINVYTQAEQDVSFYNNGSRWYDLADSSAEGVFRIKAYTDGNSAGIDATTGTGSGSVSGSTDDGNNADTGNGGAGSTTDAKDTDAGDNGSGADSLYAAALTKLSLNKQKLSLVNGKTYRLTVTPTYSKETATEWMVYWKSSNSSVVSVSDYGKLTAKKPGSATITVYNGSVKDTCTVTVLPKKVSNFHSALKNGKVKLTWSSAEDASGYVIYRATSKNGTYKRVKTIKNASTTSVTLASHKGETAYYYKIRSYKTVSGKRLYSSYSDARTVVTLGLSGVKAAAKKDVKIALSWKQSSKTSGYEIYRATKQDGTYRRIKTVKGAEATSFTDKTVKAGKSYYYKVRAYRLVDGEKVYSGFSEVVSAKAKE